MHAITRFVAGLCLLVATTAGRAVAAPSISPAATIAAAVSPNVVNLNDFTATSDPDQLLGLPGQYTSKATFTDLDHLVGTVEVFARPEDLAGRLFQLQAVRGSASQEIDLPADANDPNARVLLRLWVPAGSPAGTAQSYANAFNAALT